MRIAVMSGLWHGMLEAAFLEAEAKECIAALFKKQRRRPANSRMSVSRN
jgi:hypothetical protein